MCGELLPVVGFAEEGVVVVGDVAELGLAATCVVVVDEIGAMELEVADSELTTVEVNNSVGCDVGVGLAVVLVDEPAELLETVKYVVPVETIAASVDGDRSLAVFGAAEMRQVS